jgi:hypothetical protein
MKDDLSVQIGRERARFNDTVRYDEFFLKEPSWATVGELCEWLTSFDSDTHLQVISGGRYLRIVSPDETHRAWLVSMGEDRTEKCARIVHELYDADEIKQPISVYVDCALIALKGELNDEYGF